MVSDVKAVIFDVDDTLFDRNSAQHGILRLMVQELPDIFAGIDEGLIASAFAGSDDLALQEYYDGGSVDTVRTGRSRAFLRLLGLSEDHADRITAMYVNRYPTINAPVEGAKSLVRKLVGRFQLAVVSNGFPDVQYRKLETLGIRHLFDCIVLSEEIGVRKPDPRIFSKAAGLLSRKPEECLYVGDSYDTDVPGAKIAGMLACWLNPDGSRPPQIDTEPDFEIRSLDEIPEILDCGNGS